MNTGRSQPAESAPEDAPTQGQAPGSNPQIEPEEEQLSNKTVPPPQGLTLGDDLGVLGNEITKLLLSSNLDYQKNVSQTLQGLTSLLLTSYIALYVALGKQYGFFALSPILTALPVALFCGSLLWTFISAASNRGTGFQVGNLGETVNAYEAVIKRRRSQVIGPGLLTLLGIASFGLVIERAI